MLALVLALLLVPAANTWTVDDDGPADFAQITDAIAQAGVGDILLVEGGNYAHFELSKRLTIVSRAGNTTPHLLERPHVKGFSRVVGEGCTLAGLDFDALRVSGVAGRGRIDDCRFGYTGDAKRAYTLDIDGCAQLVVSRSKAHGSEAYSDSHFDLGGVAMQIRTSNVTVVECNFRGASGGDAGFDTGGKGGTALGVSEGSRALVVATTLVGGLEGYGFGFSCFDGPSGTGLLVIGSQVTVRGVPQDDDYIAPGLVDGVCTDILGPAIDVEQGLVIVSGVGFNEDNVKVVGGTLVELEEPEPLMMITGTDFPGGQRDIQVHGPEGAPCLLFISAVPAYAPLATFDDKLWVGVNGPYLLIPLVTTGQDTPVKLSWTVPLSTAGIAGVSFEMQPFFPGIASTLEPGKFLAGNVAELIVRF
jgi:hypothetical protein